MRKPAWTRASLFSTPRDTSGYRTRFPSNGNRNQWADHGVHEAHTSEHVHQLVASTKSDYYLLARLVTRNESMSVCEDVRELFSVIINRARRGGTRRTELMSVFPSGRGHMNWYMAEEYFVKSTSSLYISSEIPPSGLESSGNCGASAARVSVTTFQFATASSSQNPKQRMAVPRRDQVQYQQAATVRSMWVTALINQSKRKKPHHITQNKIIKKASKEKKNAI